MPEISFGKANRGNYKLHYFYLLLLKKLNIFCKNTIKIRKKII